MIDLFHYMLASLANNPANNFTLMDTRNTLAQRVRDYCSGFYNQAVLM
jgi:hypothetical protein